VQTVHQVSGGLPWFEGMWVDLHQMPSRPWEVFPLIRPHPAPAAVSAEVIVADENAVLATAAFWPMLAAGQWPLAVAGTVAAYPQVASRVHPDLDSWQAKLTTFALAWLIAG